MRLRCVLLMLVALLLNGCGGNVPADGPASQVMVEYTTPGGLKEVITVTDFLEFYGFAYMQINRQQALGGQPQMPPAAEMFEEYLAQQVAAAHAREAGITVDAEQIDAQLEGIQGLETTQGQQDFAAENGFSSMQALRAFIADNLLFNELASREVEAGAVHARHILLGEGIDPAKPAEEQQEAFDRNRALADQIHAQLLNGGDFAELAIEHSTDPGSGQNGGDLGFMQRGQTVEPFDQALFALEENEISQPVKTQFGWHIIQRLEGQADREQANAWMKQLVATARTEGRLHQYITADDALGYFSTPTPAPQPTQALPPGFEGEHGQEGEDAHGHGEEEGGTDR